MTEPRGQAPLIPRPAATAVLPDARPLEREAKMLATARAALAAGDSSAAAKALDDYDRTFPEGQLRDEADVLRGRLTTPE